MLHEHFIIKTKFTYNFNKIKLSKDNFFILRIYKGLYKLNYAFIFIQKCTDLIYIFILLLQRFQRVFLGIKVSYLLWTIIDKFIIIIKGYFQDIFSNLNLNLCICFAIIKMLIQLNYCLVMIMLKLNSQKFKQNCLIFVIIKTFQHLLLFLYREITCFAILTKLDFTFLGMFY